MKIEFDPAKNARNIAEREIPFERAEDFEWETAVIVRDSRRDYKETRFRAMGMIGESSTLWSSLHGLATFG